jgi:hypothetical protein
MRRLIPLLAAASVAAGCGSGPKEVTFGHSTRETPRSRWVDKIDSLCAIGDGEFRKIPPLSQSAQRDFAEGNISEEVFSEIARVTGRAIPIGRRLDRKIESVPRPNDPLLDRWLELGRKTSQDLQRLHAAAVARDVEALKRAAQTNGRDVRAYVQLSQRLDFLWCGRTTR